MDVSTNIHAQYRSMVQSLVKSPQVPKTEYVQISPANKIKYASMLTIFAIYKMCGKSFRITRSYIFHVSLDLNGFNALMDLYFKLFESGY